MRPGHSGKTIPGDRHALGRKPLPVARPYLPPPDAPNLCASLWRRIKFGALIALGVVSVAVGAIYLPGITLRSEPKAALPPPVAQTKGEPRPKSDSTPTTTIAEPTATANIPTAQVPAVPSDPMSDRRLIDAPPPVAPQKPAADGAFAVAAVIDREIDKALLSAGVPASPLASDAEFLRRVYLDLTGRIPSHARAVAFFDSTDPYKRSHLIDELLASPEYGQHFAHLWADILIKRDFENNKNLKADAFTRWLAEQFNQGRGWDQIVADLLTVEGREDQVPQTFFYLANQDNNQPAPNKLVGTAANLFMGIQLQCAECHTHPHNSKWTQQDFWGLAAFFGHTRFERDTTNKKQTGPAMVKELDRQPAAGKPNKNVKPLPVGATIAIPDPNDTRKVTGTAAAKYFEGDQPALGNKGPYRPNLAGWLTSMQNRYFAPAAVNRMWHHFFARGFVNPIEEMGGEHPPSHPELLQLLADELVRSGYDLKSLIRAVCNSSAYQRTSRPLAANKDDEKLFSHMPVKVMSARMLLDSLAVATGKSINKDAGNPNRGNKNAAGGGLLRFFDTAEYDEDPTEYTYGIPQVLRLMNSALSNSSAEAAARVVKSAGGNAQKAIEDIYLAALSRRPSPAELRKMTDFVARQGDAKGYGGVFWALLNSAEFVSNH